MFLKLSTQDPSSFDQLNDLELNPHAILLLSYHEWQYNSLVNKDSFEQVVEYSNIKNIPFYIVTGSVEESKPLYDVSNSRYNKIQIISIPTLYVTSWLYYFKERFENNDTDIESSYFNKNFKYLFLSLNNKPHPFRCMQMDMLAKYNLLEHGAVSWNSWEGYNGRNIDQYVNYAWKYWEPKLLILDEIEGNNLGWTSQLPEQFNNSFLHFIPETTPHAVFLSEKIVPALMFCKVFLVSAAKDYYKTLKKYDILPYDEIFDYSFDDVDDNETRADLLAKNINAIKHYNSEELTDIYQKLLPKIIHNKKSFYKLATDISLWPEFVLDLCKIYPDEIRNNSIYHYYNLHTEGPTLL